MKTKQIDDLNLIELTKQESQQIDGGAWLAFAVAYVLIEVALNPTAHYNALVDGINEAYNSL
jgi:hypothetical protein